jgi:hypothetical protein
MVFIWLLTAVTWAAHVGLALVPGSLPLLFIAGQLPLWVQVTFWAALLPQLILVPWAWRDSGRRSLSRTSRVVWRILFFFTGFVAVTAYAARYRLARAGRPR